MSKPSFTITYSRNWDGGHQEYQTAADCVSKVFPGCDITPNRTDKYPIRVSVTANVGGSKIDVWSGSQRDLFRKYASNRLKAIQQITANLEDLKEELE
jgi:hypothetical protein